MRPLAPAAGLLLAASLLPACSVSPAGPQPAAPTYRLPPRTVRPGEQAVQPAYAASGDVSFTVIGLTTGMPELVGSHADIPAKGRFVRIRVIVANTGRNTVTIRTARQRLIDDHGRLYAPDHNAMLIKRQPDELRLGSAMRIEFDLWYDIPATARPRALRVSGAAALTGRPPDADLPLPS